MARTDSDGMVNAAGVAYGDLIRRQRCARKMSQEELGALVHVGKNAVGAWEAGRSRPDVGSVPVICDALDLSLEEFFGLTDKDTITGLRGLSDYVRPAEATELLRRFAILNRYNRQVILREMEMLLEMQKTMRSEPRRIVRLYRNELAASAGPGETLEAARGDEVWLFADAETEAADEIIRVHGNSMEPTFRDGDEVLVKHTSTLREREIGVFIVGDTGYIKEYRRDGLYSHNPMYPVLRFRDDTEVRCVGRVLGAVRPDQWAEQ